MSAETSLCFVKSCVQIKLPENCFAYSSKSVVSAVKLFEKIEMQIIHFVKSRCVQ